MVIGSARVSTSAHSLDQKIDERTASGCRHVYRKAASGKRGAHRPRVAGVYRISSSGRQAPLRASRSPARLSRLNGQTIQRRRTRNRGPTSPPGAACGRPSRPVPERSGNRANWRGRGRSSSTRGARGRARPAARRRPTEDRRPVRPDHRHRWTTVAAVRRRRDSRGAPEPTAPVSRRPSVASVTPRPRQSRSTTAHLVHFGSGC